jgi:hypothetical protein
MALSDTGISVEATAISGTGFEFVAGVNAFPKLPSEIVDVGAMFVVTTVSAEALFGEKPKIPEMEEKNPAYAMTGHMEMLILHIKTKMSFLEKAPIRGKLCTDLL